MSIGWNKGPGPLLCHPNAPPLGTKGTKALHTTLPNPRSNPAVPGQKVLSPAQQVLESRSTVAALAPDIKYIQIVDRQGGLAVRILEGERTRSQNKGTL